MQIAVGIIANDDQYLCIQREQQPFKNRLCLPGGKLEADETAETALRREVEEETDLPIEQVTRIGTCNETFHGDETFEHEITVFDVQPEHYDYQRSDEGSLHWISINADLLVPSDRLFLQYYEENTTFDISITMVKTKQGYDITALDEATSSNE